MENAMILRKESSLNPERLEHIENRIRDNLNRYAESVIDIGRCLNQAKDEKLVPDGQWVQWVENTTGMGIRTAQRLMKAAREVPGDSSLVRLSFSKVHALLALPAEERESFAEEVDAENKSVRELQAAIDAKLAAEKARDAEERKRKALEGEVDRLHEQLNNPPVDAKAQEEIERLNAELEEREEELDRRAAAEKQAKAELLSLRTQVARGTASASNGEILTHEELGAAVDQFIGRANALPYMRTQLATSDHKTRAAYKTHVERVADWCRQAVEALNSVCGEVVEI